MWLYNKLYALFNPVTATRSTGEPFILTLLKAFGYTTFYFFIVGLLIYFIIIPLAKRYIKQYQKHKLPGVFKMLYKDFIFLLASLLLGATKLFDFIITALKSIYSYTKKLFNKLPGWVGDATYLAICLSLVLRFLVVASTTYYHYNPPEPTVVTKTQYIYRYVDVPTPCACCTCDPCICIVPDNAPKCNTPEIVPIIQLTDEDRRIAENIICGEAGNQSYLGKQLVAECLWNAMYKDNLTMSEVRKQYGYEGYRELSNWGTEEQQEEVREAVRSIFDRNERPIQENILYFYSTVNGMKNNWHETQRFVIWEGDHRFFALKDY